MQNNETDIRPQRLDDFVGQQILKQNLRIAIDAARLRGEALDHVLLYGSPGLGKTTLSHIIAREMGTVCKATVAPAIKQQSDLTLMLLELGNRNVLFIDEIHRLPIQYEESLYSALEDFCLDLVVGHGATAKSMNVTTNPFTFVGATTAPGLLSAPLRSRFGLILKMEPYTLGELRSIVQRTAAITGIGITDEAADDIAGRCRATPRIANRLLRRSRDTAQTLCKGIIDKTITHETLERMGVDPMGLDETDTKLLRTIIERYRGGPVGVNTLAASLSENPNSIEEVYEPFLIESGLLDRTPQGRIATEKAFVYFGYDTSLMRKR